MPKTKNRYKQKLGVAVVGLGVGEQHAKTYLELKECELLWLYDIQEQKTRQCIQALGEGKEASSFEQILQDERVDIISIASYDDAHYQQVCDALDAGKHIFVEKPLVRTLEELAVVKQKWQKHKGKLKLSSNLILRAAPLYQWLKTKLLAQNFGDVYAFDGEYLYGRVEKITHGWRKEVKDYSVIFGGGIHLIDLMLWLLRERPKTVFAQGNKIVTKNSPYQYDDYVTVMVNFPSGCIGRISANFGCVHRHHHVLRLYGTKATLLYDDAGARMHFSRDEQLLASVVNYSPLPKHKGELIPAFISAILEGEDFTEHTQTMFNVISVCAACDESLKTNSLVEVKYV